MKHTEMIFEELLKYKDRLIADGVWAGMDADEKKELNEELVRKSKSKEKSQQYYTRTPIWSLRNVLSEKNDMMSTPIYLREDVAISIKHRQSKGILC